MEDSGRRPRTSSDCPDNCCGALPIQLGEQFSSLAVGATRANIPAQLMGIGIG